MSESLYRELLAGHFRLLRLLPNADVQDLNYSLETGALDTAPAYIALSYTWSNERGDNTSTRAIVVNGKRLEARLNLWALLSSIYAFDGYYVWVDADCICQEKVEEGNHQVQSMGAIFKATTVVIAWLSSGQVQERTHQSEHYWNSHKNIEAFATRPYWSRLWIVQELLLGQKIIVLSKATAMEWCEFYDGFVAVYHPQQGPVRKLMLEFRDTVGISSQNIDYEFIGPRAVVVQVPTAGSLILARGRAGQEVQRRPLHKLLLDYHKQQCEDRRDKVFALLNLLPEKDRSVIGTILPDYCLTHEEVVVVALSHLQEFDRRDITVGWDAHWQGLGVTSREPRAELLRLALEYEYLKIANARLENSRQCVAARRSEEEWTK